MSRQKTEIIKRCKFAGHSRFEYQRKRRKGIFTIIICLNEMIVIGESTMTRQFAYKKLHSREVYSISCLQKKFDAWQKCFRACDKCNNAQFCCDFLLYAVSLEFFFLSLFIAGYTLTFKSMCVVEIDTKT